MKSQLLNSINNITYQDTLTPVPTAGEVLVRVHAAGICGSDIPRIYTTGAHVHPIIPGHEFSGEVVELGTSVDSKWSGKRVGIFPLIPCKQCPCCIEKKYEMCTNYNYLGSRCNGGFAEYVAVPEWNLIELPDNVSYEAAAMLEPMAVAAHAVRAITDDLRGDLLTKRIAVCGLGTIGLLIAMLLKSQGAEDLLLIGNKESQRKAVEALGINPECYHAYGNIKSEKADIIFECVGKNETITQAINLCSPGGRIMLVGNPHSDMSFDKDIYWKILRSQITLKGTWNSSYIGDETDDWHFVLNLLKEKKINPETLISHKFSLEDLQQGLHIMRDKSEDYIKIMCIQ